MAGGCSTIFPVPRSDGAVRALCGIVNIIIPGLGLFLLSLNYNRYYPAYNQTYGWISLLQFLLAFVGIGWIWAFVNGLVMIYVGLTYGDKEFGAARERDQPHNHVQVVL